MTDRELRLRERIDQVTDERDRARKTCKRYANRLYRMTRSRDNWRLRALSKR